MNKYKVGLLQWMFGLICVSFVACDNGKSVFPKSTFENSFPKKNKNLASILGNHLILKMDNDTLRLKISEKNGFNLITSDDKGNPDTLFYGTVCKFRGMYYFSQKVNDTAYWIFAVRKSGDKIYGMNGMFIEQLQIEKEVIAGKYPKLLKYMSKDTSVIRLYTDKKLIRKILEPFVDTLKPLTIMHFEKTNDTTQFKMDSSNVISAIDSEEFEIISKVYPNPASDFVNLELQEQGKVLYKLSDIIGKELKQGECTEMVNKIDVSDMPAGLYILTVTSADGKISESVRVVKG